MPNLAVHPSAPRVEHLREPLGIGEPSPRLSWRTTAPDAWRQRSYEVEITRGGSARTFRTAGAAQVLVPWPDAPLRSRETATVRVRVTGTDGDPSAWSEPTVLETGLLTPSDWVAKPVGGAWPEVRESDERRPALVRRSFHLPAAPVRARLYATAHGMYEAEVNGSRVGDDALSPGWTTYAQRLRYYTYDVTDLLTAGDNAIGSWLGDGWYRGRMGWRGGFRNVFGDDLSFLGQLEVETADGGRHVIATDRDWRAATGPILRSGNYDGEDYDAREERSGWSSPGFDDHDWTPVAVRWRDPATLVAPDGPPVRCTRELVGATVLNTPSGRTVLDFGQNLVGRLRIRVRGDRGTTVTLRTAEVMQEGEVYRRPLREARSADSYTLAGRDEPEGWEPRFTFHGFRYVDVEGWPGDLEQAVAAGDIVARVYHTDMERTGWFECSDELVNRLHENVVWSMRGNFVDIPTDCPQRDERVGWTGDIQVFAPTAAFLFDVTGMLSGWLKDVSAEQLPDGTVPWYVPVIPAHQMWTPIRPGAAWGDVATLTPWALYERTGDAGLLDRQFETARRWVDLQDHLAGDDHLWDDGFQLGDWLDPSAPPQDPAAGATDRYLVATAYFAASAAAVARMASVLGRAEDEARYAALADDVASAFRDRWGDGTGLLTNDAQTAYAVAIRFGLLPESQLPVAGTRLAELVAAGGNRIGTGFVGTPLISDALSSTGGLDRAYELLMEQECPSWLYPVTRGATTIWERWDSLRPDGTVNPGTMTSFNHYALGAVADWLHRVVAGLSAAEPGYRRILFAPRPGGGLTRASARHDSPYGTVAIAWTLEDATLTVRTTVPSGTEAVLDLPDGRRLTLGPGTRTTTAAVAAAV